MKTKAVSALINIGASLLTTSESSRLDAQLLLSSCLGYDKIRLITHPQELITSNSSNKYFFLIGQRARNIPLAYLLNNKEFYGLDFKVSGSVLIPRPETETMIDIALKLIKNKKEDIKILDLGTGSGCIAISLASALINLNKNKFTIDAIDNSASALKVARINKKTILGINNKQVKLKRLDYIKQELPCSYDLILANPPYLNLEEYKLSKRTAISFEPKNALYGAKDGLKYFKRINELLYSFLKPQGVAIIEIGQQSKGQLRNIFNKSFQIKYQKDLTGFKRFLIISHQS